MKKMGLLSFLIFATTVATFPTSSTSNVGVVQTIYEFPNETWVENLVTRPNGKILVTLFNVPELWEVDTPRAPATAELIYRFPNATALLGIAEYAEDTFAVNVGNFSLSAFQAIPQSWSVWTVDLSSGVKASKITDIPTAAFLNGMTTLPANSNIILTADSGSGKIFAVNAMTGSYDVAIAGSFLLPNASDALQLGVNGIQFGPDDPSQLYFSNSEKTPSFASVPINSNTGNQAGPVDVVYERAPYPISLGFSGDDFAIDPSGQYAWLTTDPSDSLVKVNLKTGQAEVVVGGVNSDQLVGPTACHFGRTAEDMAKGRLYITTNGGIPNPPASGVVGGKLVAVDTRYL